MRAPARSRQCLRKHAWCTFWRYRPRLEIAGALGGFGHLTPCRALTRLKASVTSFSASRRFAWEHDERSMTRPRKWNTRNDAYPRGLARFLSNERELLPCSHYATMPARRLARFSPALIKLAHYPVDVRGVWRASVLWSMSISARPRGDFSR